MAFAPRKDLRQVTNILQTENVHLSIQQKSILKDISCLIKEKSVSAILGPNGSGKTMLLRCLAGIVQPCSGHVKWRREGTMNSLTALELAKIRSWVPVSQAIAFDFTVIDLMLMSRYFLHQGFPSHVDQTKAEEALERLNIQSLTNRGYNTLSRGEQTKVDIARALAQGTSVILMDEPFANLDVDAQLLFSHLLKDLKREGKTVVFSHHDLSTIPYIADEILYIKEGALVAQGSVEALFSEKWIEAVYNIKSKIYDHLVENRIFLDLQLHR
jgi:iron complex transport system ATP-binding protein